MSALATSPLEPLVDELVKAIAREVVRLQAQAPKAGPAGLISAVEIGKRVGRCTRTVKNWMREPGVLPYRLINRRWYATTEDFEKFLKRRRSGLKVA